jgi:hypothetical protein
MLIAMISILMMEFYQIVWHKSEFTVSTFASLPFKQVSSEWW